MQGTLLLLAYSLGLGVPFFLSALLIQKLKGALDWVKAHYSAVDRSLIHIWRISEGRVRDI